MERRLEALARIDTPTVATSSGGTPGSGALIHDGKTRRRRRADAAGFRDSKKDSKSGIPRSVESILNTSVEARSARGKAE